MILTTTLLGWFGPIAETLRYGRLRKAFTIDPLRKSSYYLDNPHTEIEKSRLDSQHQIWLRLFNGKLFTAPINTRRFRHLDVGCGSAIWTIDMAISYPEARIAGVDLTIPSYKVVPQNITFIKADALKSWDWSHNYGSPYDLITVRVLVTGINDWGLLFNHCYAHISPGGWLEVHDIVLGTFSDTVDWQDESNPLMSWYQYFRKGAALRGIDGFAGRDRVQKLRSAGFINVKETLHHCYLDKLAVNDEKSRQIAQLTRRNFFDLIESVTTVMVAKGDWTSLEITEKDFLDLKERAKQEIMTNSAREKYYWIM